MIRVRPGSVCEDPAEAKLLAETHLYRSCSGEDEDNFLGDALNHSNPPNGDELNKIAGDRKRDRIPSSKNIRTDFECKACGKSFEKQKGLSLHKTRYCKFSRKGVPSGAPVTSTVNPNSDNSFRCANCNSTYKTLGGLRIHQSSKLGKAKCQRLKAARIANAEVVQDPPINLAQNHEIFDWKNAKELPNKVDTPDIVKIMVRKPKLKLPHLNCQQEWTNLEEKILKGLKSIFIHKDLDKLVVAYEDHIYNVCKEVCGVIDKKKKKEEKKFWKKKKKPTCLENLRKKKSEARRLFRLAKRENRNVKEAHKNLMSTVRAYGDLCRLTKKAEEVKMTKAERSRFLQDPNKYAMDLFAPLSSGGPTFTKEVADDFFPKTYIDSDRSYQYEPFPGLPRPNAPKVKFDTALYTKEELTSVVKSRRNGSAPGFNGIPYTIYKRCPGVVAVLLIIMNKVQKAKYVPLSWRVGRVTIIPKTEVTDRPDKMRPITVLSSEGRLFWCVFQRRMASFMLKNEYITRSVQKAFLEKTAGCIEHCAALDEVIRDARESQRQIVISWLDLANAYGSVRHSLILFVLKWYHVPSDLIDLFRSYLDGIFLQVQTSKWSSVWYPLAIGVPQGCTAATIVFDVVFQMILDIHYFLTRGITFGYTISETSICVKAPAYADDVALVEDSPKMAQISLSKFDESLRWTKTMKLKPVKCKTLAFKKFLKNKIGRWKRPSGSNASGWGPFDPELRLGNHSLVFIGFEDCPIFKYLGRKIQFDLKEDIVLKDLLAKTQNLLKLVDETRLTGPMKSWIADQYILAKISFVLMVQDFSETDVSKIQALFHRRYRAWMGLAKSADGDVLYRSNKHFGLNIKNVNEVTRRLRVIKWHIMKNSLDLQSRLLYSNRLLRDKQGHVGQGRKSSPCIELEDALYDVKFRHLVGVTQVGTTGLGCTKEAKERKTMSERDWVKLSLKEKEEQKRLIKCLKYQKQSDWVKWSEQLENSMEKDLTWQKVLHQYSHRLTRFVINSFQDTLPSPDNLMRWNNSREYKCGLCHNSGATAKHILVGCSWVHNYENKVLGRGRYTWRHNRVLRVIETKLKAFIDHVNKVEVEKKAELSQAPIGFVKAGNKEKLTKSKRKITKRRYGWLDDARDWECYFDLEGSRESDFHGYISPKDDILPPDLDFKHSEGILYVPPQPKQKLIFPHEVCVTDLEPDGYIISYSKRIVIIVELTVPAEDNVRKWHSEKTEKYNDIKKNAEKGWTVFTLALECGVRGWTPNFFYSDLRRLGLPPKDITDLTTLVIDAARKSSYVIFINRENKHFRPEG